MNSNCLNLYDLATVSIDVEKRRSIVCICDSCNERMSSYLYVVKLIFYGIFHVCEPCQKELVTIADPRNTTFVKK
jgi:hypothetical protein